MRIYKDFIQVDVGSFYPISRIKEIRYWNYSPMTTEIVFDDGRVVKNDSSLVKTIYELYGKGDYFFDVFNIAKEQ